MAVLVGIDEAGFGPILGPLVVSSAAFSIPEQLLDADLWQILKRSIAKQRKNRAGRLLIADSKKAYVRSAGIGHLERTVLSVLHLLGHTPKSLHDLLTVLSPDSVGRLDRYPWHKNPAGYHISAIPADIQIAAGAFNRDMQRAGIRPAGLRSLCFDVAYYNQMVSATRNKAEVLFNATSQLIQHAWQQFGSDNLQIVIDRQGGRAHYTPTLRKIFPNLELTELSRTPKHSSYELSTCNRTMRLHFVVSGDDRFMPVSLASMVSKYLRELLMANINRYFIAQHKQLKPTAGYWKDGRRFINDLKTHLPHVRYDHQQLIRSR